MRSDYRQRTLQEGAERFTSQRGVCAGSVPAAPGLLLCFLLLLLGWLLAPKLQQTYKAVDGNIEDRTFTLCEGGGQINRVWRKEKSGIG